MSTSVPDDQAADQVADHAADQGDGEGGIGTEPGGVDPEVLLHHLANSAALLPQQGAPEGEEPPDGAIALPVIERDGTQYVPVFTSEEALRAAGADPSTALKVSIAQLGATWPSEDLWLAVDPATPDGLVIPPEVVRALPGFVDVAAGAGAATEQEGGTRQEAADAAPSD